MSALVLHVGVGVGVGVGTGIGVGVGVGVGTGIGIGIGVPQQAPASRVAPASCQPVGCKLGCCWGRE